MLVISRYGLDAKRFDGSSNNWSGGRVGSGGYSFWRSVADLYGVDRGSEIRSSEIRKWLNGEFYNGSFAAEEKALIKSFNQDNVFLLSKEEVEKYFANKDARKCKATAYAKAKGASVNNDGYCWWWLRSAIPRDSNLVYYVSNDGVIYSLDVCGNCGSVRPALWINLES